MRTSFRTPRAAAVLTAAVGFAAAGCNDKQYLTETPYSSVSTGQFYKTQGDALAAVNAAYGGLENGSSGNGNYYGGFFVMTVEFLTEMQTPYLSAGNERSQVDNYTFTPSHSYFYATWVSAYDVIKRTNAVIGRVPAIPMDTALRTRIVGEAKFLRALNYFNLVRMFGGVPLSTTETVALDSLSGPRATAPAVYAQIVTDLKDAIAVLPKASAYASSDVGRASRGAAKTLLAKVYLQRAGTGVSTDVAGDYQAALAMLTDVDQNEGYSLVANYGDLFDMQHKVNTEVIFDIQCVRVAGVGCHLSNQDAPRNSNYGTAQNGSFTAEQPFFDAFKTTDVRRALTWQLSFTNKAGATATWDSTQSASKSYGADTPYMRKFLDIQSTGDDNANYIVLRYADNLLMESEILNQLSGPTTPAYAGVNKVRVRAGLPNLVTGLSQAAFKDSVFAQRRLELAMEGPNGHFDSQRDWAWASGCVMANMALGAANKFKNSKYPKAQTTIDDHFRLLPIPQRAIDLNTALQGSQNPGY